MKALRSMPRPVRLSKSSIASRGNFSCAVLQQASLFALGRQIDFAIDEQCQTLLEAHGVDVGLAHLLFEREGESVQLKSAQLIEGVVFEHGRCPWNVGDHW
jgi:hypothetical protein